jgi:hypothetical protein
LIILLFGSTAVAGDWVLWNFGESQSGFGGQKKTEKKAVEVYDSKDACEKAAEKEFQRVGDAWRGEKAGWVLTESRPTTSSREWNLWTHAANDILFWVSSKWKCWPAGVNP